MCEDDSVQRTNDDASLCKRSAVNLGYWRDPYLAAFVPKSALSGEPRKAPEIHLGYFTRVQGLWKLLTNAIDLCREAGTRVQIVNLGAGFDTLYWRLLDHFDELKVDPRKVVANFVDVDLPEVTARKCMSVRRSKELLGRLASRQEEEEVQVSRTDLHASDYHVLAADFTNAASMEAKLAECGGFDYALPTLFLAECVLVYIDEAKTKKFLTWITSKFSSSVGFLGHEQLNMRDRFGHVMLENLAQRGCGLPGVEACRDKKAQIDRMTQCGWDAAKCWTMNEAYNLLPPHEVSRVEKLERLDERELASQLFEHYCITFAYRNANHVSLDELEI